MHKNVRYKFQRPNFRRIPRRAHLISYHHQLFVQRVAAKISLDPSCIIYQVVSCIMARLGYDDKHKLSTMRNMFWKIYEIWTAYFWLRKKNLWKIKETKSIRLYIHIKLRTGIVGVPGWLMWLSEARHVASLPGIAPFQIWESAFCASCFWSIRFDGFCSGWHKHMTQFKDVLYSIADGNP